ncbi:HAD family hydrolase [Streptomyces sp. NPDC002467]|uniref:HAD family hydrolase n=1 Tax=Streptomyces sp. NPDC002467 TaxID=3364647 RepID=UPI00368854B7
MTTTRESAAPRPFDAVLCDLDNVIRFYDTSGLAELERAAALPVGTTEEVAFSPELDGPALLGRVTVAQWVESVATALAAGGGMSGATARALATAFAEAPFAADEAVVGVLRAARAAGLVLVLVTNATQQLEDDLVSMGLSDLADHVVSSARVGVAKPDRGIYEIAAGRAGVAPERCLFVDDRRENVEAAVALGMTGVHYREPADLRAALGFPA